MAARATCCALSVAGTIPQPTHPIPATLSLSLSFSFPSALTECAMVDPGTIAMATTMSTLCYLTMTMNGCASRKEDAVYLPTLCWIVSHLHLIALVVLLLRCFDLCWHRTVCSMQCTAAEVSAVHWMSISFHFTFFTSCSASMLEVACMVSLW